MGHLTIPRNVGSGFPNPERRRSREEAIELPLGHRIPATINHQPFPPSPGTAAAFPAYDSVGTGSQVPSTEHPAPNTSPERPPLYKQYHPTRIAVLMLLVCGLCAVRPASASISPDEQKLLSQINSADMMRTVERLCADDFDGRRAGSPQHDKVVEYMASRFQACGLTPLHGDGMKGYEQPLTMRYSLVRNVEDIKATISYAKAGSPQSRTFSYSNYNGRGGLDLRSKLVFVGYGVQDPGTGRDDYKGLNVNGKIVLWIAGQPKEKLSKPSTGAQKMLTAYQHGAVACLAYRTKDIEDEFGTNLGLEGSIADFPCIAVDKAIAAELLGADPVTARPGMTGADVRLRVPAVCDPERKTFNVLGVVAGTDPKLRDEMVMVGAHSDHLGDMGPAQIFRGADDNASGTSVVLETAQSIMRSGLKPRRTMIFASWTGEECGLVGSNYFAAHPPFPLKEIVSNFELDMVGQGDPTVMRTTGARAYPDHYRSLASSAADLGITLDADTIHGISDYVAFTRKGIPSSLISSGGEHVNYHTVRDVPAGLNPDVLESVAKLVALSAWRAANN